MTDQERDELRELQDELLTIAYRQHLQPHDLIISQPPITVREFETTVYPKLRDYLRHLHRQYYPQNHA